MKIFIAIFYLVLLAQSALASAEIIEGKFDIEGYSLYIKCEGINQAVEPILSISIRVSGGEIL